MRNFGEAHKKDEFLEIYDKHFFPWKDKHTRLLEIGVQYGGSLKIWREYFKDLELTGVDILPGCTQYATDTTKILIGDQSNRDFLESLGSFDIVIDDGGHTMVQQQETFKVLFPKLSSGGIYVIEDTHTSYWKQFQDSSLKTTDFVKSLTDQINADATMSSRCEEVRIENTYEISSIHFYESVILIHKK